MPRNGQDPRGEGVTRKVLSRPVHRLQAIHIVVAIFLIHSVLAATGDSQGGSALRGPPSWWGVSLQTSRKRTGGRWARRSSVGLQPVLSPEAKEAFPNSNPIKSGLWEPKCYRMKLPCDVTEMTSVMIKMTFV